MFDNPILFALLIGVIASLLYFFVNKDKDKVDKNPNKNTNRQSYKGNYFYISGNFYIANLESLKVFKSFFFTHLPPPRHHSHHHHHHLHFQNLLFRDFG